MVVVSHDIALSINITEGLSDRLVVCKISYILLLIDIYAQHIYLCFKSYIVVIYSFYQFLIEIANDYLKSQIP